MSISHRLARLRDGSLRLRVTATGEHREMFEFVWPDVSRFRRIDESEWNAHVTITGPDRLSAFLDALETSTDPALLQLARRLRDDLDRLADAHAKRQAAPTPGPVIDDAALRRLVHLDRPRARAGDLILDELGITAGEIRADIAALTDTTWTGWELKGERDSLTRLPRQVAGYGAVFDRCELVTTEHHPEPALRLVPQWWTVRVATGPLPNVPLKVARLGSENPEPSAVGRAQLLWRDETLEVLRSLGLAKGLSKATQWDLWARLAAEVDAEGLKPVVLGVIRRRQGWRVPHPV